MSNNKSTKERTGLYWNQLLEIRSKILFEQDYGCGECGSKIGEIQGDAHMHHIDGNPKNNNRGNLIVLCVQHHAQIHDWSMERWEASQPLYSTDKDQCSICGRKPTFNGGELCPKCYREHYSNYHEGKRVNKTNSSKILEEI